MLAMLVIWQPGVAYLHVIKLELVAVVKEAGKQELFGGLFEFPM